MNRKHFVLALLAMSLGSAVLAQGDNDAPLVGAPKIIEALSAKDIVLDRPGAPATHARRHDPAISLQVQFTFGSAQLLPQGKRQLDELAMALKDNALLSASFELAGHTDGVGDAESNLRLSIDRANAVKIYLTAVHGLSAARLQTIGYGFNRLADPANPAAAVNRRVEVRRLHSGAGVPPTPAPATGGRLVPTPR